MIVIGKDTNIETQNNNKDSQQDTRIDSLQTAVDSLNAQVSAISASIMAINASIEDKYSAQTQTLMSALSSQINALSEALSSVVSTAQVSANIGIFERLSATISANIEQLTALAGNINALTSEQINAQSVEVSDSVVTDELQVERATITEAILTRVAIETFTITNLVAELLKADQIESEIIKADEVQSGVVKAVNLTGKGWQTPIGTPDNTELLKITIPLYEGVVQVITEGNEFNVSILNNVFVSWTEKSAYLYRIQLTETAIELYLQNIGDTVNYQLLFIGSTDTKISTSEIVDKTGIRQNILTFSGYLNTSPNGSGTGAQLVIVDVIPEEGEEGVIYFSPVLGAWTFNPNSGETGAMNALSGTELLNAVNANTTHIGNLSTLLTVAKNNLVSAINELYNTINSVVDNLENKKQDKLLTSPVIVDDTTATTVEGALGALNLKKQNKTLNMPITANGETATTVEDALDALNAEDKIIEGNLTVKGNTTLKGNLTLEGDINGDATVDGKLHVKGDLYIDGIGEEIVSTELKVGANTITLRDGNPTGLATNEIAGVVTHNYDGHGNNNIIAVDANGNARVGDVDIATRLLYSSDGNNFFEDENLTIAATIGQDEIVRDTGNTTSGGVKIYEGTTFSNNNTQPMATREEEANMIDGYGVTWNSTKKCLETSFIPSTVIPQNIQADTTITGIVADRCVYITAANAITLTLANASQVGIKIRIINTTSLTHTLSLNSVSINVPHILPMANVEIMWNGVAWQHIGGCAVGETFEQKPQCDSPFDIFPCSGWVELISHNGAFYRSANAPTTLYTLDAVTFYADVERLNPVDWSGIKNADGTPGTVSDTGNTQFNSRGEEMKIYAGSWTSGNAAAYINKTDDLIVQQEGLPNITGGFQSTDLRQLTGCFYEDPGRIDGTYDSAGSFTKYCNFDASRSNSIYGNSNHVTPVNYSIRIWKRIA